MVAWHEFYLQVLGHGGGECHAANDVGARGDRVAQVQGVDDTKNRLHKLVVDDGAQRRPVCLRKFKQRQPLVVPGAQQAHKQANQISALPNKQRHK